MSARAARRSGSCPFIIFYLPFSYPLLRCSSTLRTYRPASIVTSRRWHESFILVCVERILVVDIRLSRSHSMSCISLMYTLADVPWHFWLLVLVGVPVCASATQGHSRANRLLYKHFCLRGSSRYDEVFIYHALYIS